MLDSRLKALRREKGVSQKELAAAMGVTQQAVGKWETGRSAPAHDIVRRLAEYFSTTTDDLLGHAGAESAGVGAFRTRMEYSIPIIGTVRAGWGSLAFEEDYGSDYANVKDPENYFFLLVKGDSMSPRIQDGDLALIRRQSTLENGEVGVVIVGEEEGTLKKFIKNNDAVVLQPFNPDYQPMVVEREQLAQLCVVGKLVETKAKW